MTKKFILLLAFVMLAFVTGCSKVPAGYVGVKFQMYGSDKGVDTEVVGPGSYLLGWQEELYIFPTFTQSYVWTRDPTEGSPNNEEFSFQDKSGTPATADIGISYSIDPSKVAAIFQKYRKGVDELTDTVIHNYVRDALVRESSKRDIEFLYGTGKVEVLDNVQKAVQDQVADIGIRIEKISWIGNIRLDPVIEEAIKQKASSTQKAQQRQNEIAQSRAEADKKIEEARGNAESTLVNAKAQAEANRILSASITPELVQYRAIEKWDGILPKITGSGNTNMIDTSSIIGK